MISNTNTDTGAATIAIGPQVLDITALASAPTIAPAGDHGCTPSARAPLEIFGSFSEFATRLNTLIGGGTKAAGHERSGPLRRSRYHSERARGACDPLWLDLIRRRFSSHLGVFKKARASRCGPFFMHHPRRCRLIRMEPSV